VLYTCHDALPSSDTNTQQIFWTLFEISRLGFDVELVVPSFNCPAEDVVCALARHYGADPALISPTFKVTALQDSAADSSLAKGWFDWRLPRRLAERAGDVIWTRDPVAAMACASSGRPTVFETYRRDLATSATFALWRGRCLPRLLGVVVHSRVAGRAFVNAGVPHSKCLVAHNGFAPALMAPPLERDTARRRIGLDVDQPLVVYAGHVGPEKGIDALIVLAASVPGARFLLLGSDPETNEQRDIEDRARRSGAGNLQVLPRVPVADVGCYLFAADVLVIPPTDEPFRRYQRTVVPMKLFSYLAAGRAILAPRTPDVEEVLQDGETALLVPPDDRNAAATALKGLLSDAALRHSLASRASASAQHFTWADRAKLIASFLLARLHDV
jgi:glycosyltransferase involved in cell wall biosynthesis